MKRRAQAQHDAKHLFLLCKTDGLLDENRARQVAQCIRNSRNRNRVLVLSEFRRLLKLDRVRHTAKVDSAMPLAPAFRAGIEAGLVRMYGRGLEISFDESSVLIGGMRIRVGSDVYDGSIQGRLAALEGSF